MAVLEALGSGQGLEHRPDSLFSLGAFHEPIEAGDEPHFAAECREAFRLGGLHVVGGEEGLRRSCACYHHGDRVDSLDDLQQFLRIEPVGFYEADRLCTPTQGKGGLFEGILRLGGWFDGEKRGNKPRFCSVDVLGKAREDAFPGEVVYTVAVLHGGDCISLRARRPKRFARRETEYAFQSGKYAPIREKKGFVREGPAETVD